MATGDSREVEKTSRDTLFPQTTQWTAAPVLLTRNPNLELTEQLNQLVVNHAIRRKVPTLHRIELREVLA